MKFRRQKTFKRRKKNAGFPKLFPKLFTYKRTPSKRTPSKRTPTKRTPSNRLEMMRELIDQYGDIRGRKPQDKELANIINEISLYLDKDTINIYKKDIQQILYEISLYLKEYKNQCMNFEKNESSILKILKKMDYVDPNATEDIIYDDVDLLDKIKNDLRYDNKHIKNLL